MKKYLVALFMNFAGVLIAQAEILSLTTPPVGVQGTELLAESDSHVAPAYTRPPVYVGKIGIASGDELFVEGLPNWGVNQFVYEAGVQPNHYYVRLGAAPEGESNPLEGWAFPVVGNASASLVLDTGGESLAGIPNGTTFKIIPYWTLDTLFPASQEGISFVASPAAYNRRTEIYFPDYDGIGINRTTTSMFYFYNGAWRRFGSAITENHGEELLRPESFFIVRNTGSNSLRLQCVGSVNTGILVVPIQAFLSGKQDNLLANVRPIAVALADLGLIESSAFVPSPSVLQTQDVLAVYNPAQTGYNKSASATYFYYNGAWRKLGQSLNLSFDDTTIGPGEGFIIRKAPAESSPPWRSSFPTP